MLDDARTLLDRLKSHNYPGFEDSLRVMDRETHNSVFPGGVTRELRVLLGE